MQTWLLSFDAGGFSKLRRSIVRPRVVSFPTREPPLLQLLFQDTQRCRVLTAPSIPVRIVRSAIARAATTITIHRSRTDGAFAKDTRHCRVERRGRGGEREGDGEW